MIRFFFEMIRLA